MTSPSDLISIERLPFAELFHLIFSFLEALFKAIKIILSLIRQTANTTTVKFFFAFILSDNCVYHNYQMKVGCFGVKLKSIFNSVTRGANDPAIVKVCLAGENQAFWFMTLGSVTGKSFLTNCLVSTRKTFFPDIKHLSLIGGSQICRWITKWISCLRTMGLRLMKKMIHWFGVQKFS